MMEQKRIKINGVWATVNVPDSLLEERRAEDEEKDKSP